MQNGNGSGLGCQANFMMRALALGLGALYSRQAVRVQSSPRITSSARSARSCLRAMASGAGESKAHTNRLASEESPYLLQHAHNPVDWYPWGQEAFDKAKAENKPIFLSIGYSTCHWCHVMERESFESEAVAELMNAHFVNVKVDREERPDVDKVYMTYLQATQGGGGWPMSVFLTPDLHPFFAGTYFPRDGPRRKGIETLLRHIAEVWRTQREGVVAESAAVLRQLGEMVEPEPSEGELSAAEQARAIDACAATLASRFDARRGGFGPAPKFPRPSEINALFCAFARSMRVLGGREAEGAEVRSADDTAKLLAMGLLSLRMMAAGGVYDQLGGGFHRYSVDEVWHVPHFEKMLYDNGQLVGTYLDAYLLSEDAAHAEVAAGILDYLLRDMAHPEGGVFAAEDADSLDAVAGKKKEGWIYVWTAAEVKSVLGAERARVFGAHYYVKGGGNCDLSPRSDPHDEFSEVNVLIARKSLEETAQLAGLSVEATKEMLGQCREELFRVREGRPRPHRDDKVVTAWNGMAISAFARAGRVLPALPHCFPVEGRPRGEYLEAAAKAADFLRSRLYDEAAGTLRRAFMRGPSPVAAFSDDYAFLIAGLLDLYSATGHVRHLRWAQALQATMDELFWDDAAGGYFQAPAGDASVLLRMKEDYDGAEPAPSSVAVANLYRLAGLSSTEASAALRQRAQRVAAAFGGRLTDVPAAMPQMCCSLGLLLDGHPRQVIIVGAAGAGDTEALLDAAHAVYAPGTAVISLDLADEERMAFWRETNPEATAVAEATGMAPGDAATAFVCQNFTCQRPTSEPAEVRRLLAQPRGGARPVALAADFKLPPRA